MCGICHIGIRSSWKEILGIWLNESESKNYWTQIFDEIKARGVEDGAKVIFPSVVVRRCIVRLI